MFTNDAETLRQFARALLVDPRNFDHPPELKIKAARKAIAKYVLKVPEDTLKALQQAMDTSDGYIPINLPIRSAVAAGHADATVKLAAYQLLEQGHLSAKYIPMPWQFRTWPEPGWDFDIDLTGDCVFYLVRANESLKMSVITGDRPCGPRDHVWLEWKRNEGLKPAAIRDRWNSLTESARRVLSPACFYKIAPKEGGRAVVKTGLSQALKEVGGE